jgi:hypothetical protein
MTAIVSWAYERAGFLQPAPRPYEFSGENRQPQRNDQKRRPRQYHEREANEQHCSTDDSYNRTPDRGPHLVPAERQSHPANKVMWFGHGLNFA